MKRLSLSLALALLTIPAAAQDLCEGNGYGGAYIEVGPAYLGGFFSHDLGSPNAPGSFAVFSFSDGFDESFHPLLGTICLDLSSPAYGLIVLPTDGAGNVHFDLFLPAVPTWVSLPPFYSHAVTFEGGAWSVAKTVPVWFENPDSWTPVASMSAPRLHHTATQLGADDRDDRIKVLVAGGGDGTIMAPAATASTEIFDPLSRSLEPGPAMQVERAWHTATRLPDGRVLLAGGLDSSGVCHRSCELYDRTTNAITPTGDMTTERACHSATPLDDGRVLVAGGFQDYQSPSGTAWEAALDSAQATCELYDPATGTWTPVTAAMQAGRAGHSATKLPDGRVMLTGGVTGGGPVGLFLAMLPLFTTTVDLFDPASEAFTALPELTIAGAGEPTGRGFHGASLAGGGNVLITGGTFNVGSSYFGTTRDCQLWNGSAWVAQALLPIDAAWHSQVVLDGGAVLLSGGLDTTSEVFVGAFTVEPKAFTGIHHGTKVTSLSAIGLNPGLPGAAPEQRGAMTATRMHDGAWLFLGGSGGTLTGNLSTGYVYTPQP